MELPIEITDELKAAAAHEGCSLLQAQIAGGTLRLIVEHPEGTRLDHCEAVSRQASALLDVHDFGANSYVLEVSSPGLDRKFYSQSDYSRFIGRKVKVRFTNPKGRKEVVRGVLEDFDPEQALVSLLEEERQQPHNLPLDCIEVTRLEVDLP